ncbi:unannotated protein [freshwater metagenome]|uniref:Unannotated protein n=1 Tax=freshwater metagenome TaxID=449393 RepID=A0A6J6Z9K6_9ZZZZ|nr:hypothetical protein [Actinomycetota bacterium]MSZ06027.1 hypothetical protein [Actinomycetota bacterium]
MKYKNPLISIGILALSLIVSTTLSASVTTKGYSETYPAVVCPPTLPGLSSAISLSSKKTRYQRLSNRSSDTVAFKVLRYSVIKDPLVINSDGTTPVNWQSRSGSWAGGVICAGPATSQWFVGGRSDIKSRGRLIVVNSGLSNAIVDIQAFSENGKQPIKSLNIKSKNYLVLSLDTLATGDRNLVVHIAPRSGRINAFMIDEQGSGLKALGGDLVNHTINASKIVMIPAIPNQVIKGKNKSVSAHTLRIMTTSESGARFTAEVLSSDGRFVPIGFSSRALIAGKVSELSIAPKISTSAFALRITSDQPIVASVSSTVSVKSHKDFVWSTPVQALGPMKIAITGLAPLVVFAGDSIAVKIEVTLINGKTIHSTIKGSDIATWRAPQLARSLAIVQASKDSFASALVVSDNGYGYFPITPGSTLTKVEIPHSNIRVLNP